ncbi:hypothetical protein BCR35DRAFT_87205 [Leucosporidium creatinivorum]|uniref:Uncharacterized protein n=1 Tax=Leucosporidium creatinivorum TaxID=106004 RepID=A0A1Y2FBE2_9BASI|nr:hypothetical protein BCR35DRAFT_87205 [Leucosporidium creatinivorum]
MAYKPFADSPSKLGESTSAPSTPSLLAQSSLQATTSGISRKRTTTALLLALLVLLSLHFNQHRSQNSESILPHARRPRIALDLPEHAYWGEARLSNPRLGGSGLTEATQGVATFISIDFPADEADPPLGDDEAISVTLEGPARLAAEVTYHGEGRYIARYLPLDAGEYTLRADVFKRGQVTKPYPYWRPLGLDSYNLTVTRQDGSLARGSGRQELAFPRNRCTGEEDTTEGRWVRCEDTPLSCVRYGWIWLPRTCYYHIYTAEELAEQDLWIAVVGTSVFRGIFFAGLDHLLGERAEQLSSPSSRFWKCWGRLSVAVHRLRLSYLDFREQCVRTKDENLCVGDYTRDAEEMLEQMGREREGRGPDVVLWEVNVNAGGNFSTLPTYRRWLGEGWDGAFLASHRTQSPEVQWNLDAVTGLAGSTLGQPELGVEAFDVSALGGAMFGTMEFPLSQASSFHWHGKCNYAGMHSCSPV